MIDNVDHIIEESKDETDETNCASEDKTAASDERYAKDPVATELNQNHPKEQTERFVQ